MSLIMYLKSIILYKSKIKLKQALSIKNQVFRYRESIICKFINTNNKIVCSEISFLRNLNQDTLFSSYLEFLRIQKFILKINWDWEQLLGESPYLSSISNRNLFPSLHFCIEIAIYKFLTKNISNQVNSSIKMPINRLLTKIEENSTISNSLNTHTLKLKIGHLAVQDALKFVQFILSNKLPFTNLRLDINAQWSFEKFLAFIQYFDTTTFEYIEEPVCSLKSLEWLSQYCNHPIALDESLKAFSLSQILFLKAIQAIILKPSSIGSLREIINLVNLAFKRGIMPIFTGVFESDIGIINVLYLIYHLDIFLPVGFDTYNWIQEVDLFFQKELYCKRDNLYICFANNLNFKVKKLQRI
uniref:4-(2'-carboxyphenyl)-4-oxybutyric acid synthase n=1 Tax=Sciadococcus taiwanensis TaxID=3028030 RepID=A0A9Y1I1Z8_9RHOD|nr:4-(2'-carboxyphenyl)-4-oxybutyric acid synthase [Sciadococcus taiwanensis]